MATPRKRVEEVRAEVEALWARCAIYNVELFVYVYMYIYILLITLVCAVVTDLMGSSGRSDSGGGGAMGQVQYIDHLIVCVCVHINIYTYTFISIYIDMLWLKNGGGEWKTRQRRWGRYGLRALYIIWYCLCVNLSIYIPFNKIAYAVAEDLRG